MQNGGETEEEVTRTEVTKEAGLMFANRAYRATKMVLYAVTVAIILLMVFIAPVLAYEYVLTPLFELMDIAFAWIGGHFVESSEQDQTWVGMSLVVFSTIGLMILYYSRLWASRKVAKARRRAVDRKESDG